MHRELGTRIVRVETVGTFYYEERMKAFFCLLENCSQIYLKIEENGTYSAHK